MKKHLKKVMVIIFILLLGKIFVENENIDWLIVFPVGNLIIYVISFFSLKFKVKDNENNKNKVQIIIYICEIFSILVHIYSAIIFKFSKIILCIPIILFIISTIIRLKGNKKIPNNISAVLVSFIYVVAIICHIQVMNIEKYNEQFLRYIDYDVKTHTQYTANIEEFVKNVIESNANNRKVSIWYEEKKYTSTEELEELLNKLDVNTDYSVNIEYDKNDKYVKNISLDKYISAQVQELLKEISQYVGNNVSASRVKSLIIRVMSWSLSGYGEATIIYNLTDDETEIVTFNYESTDNDLLRKIDSQKLYNVEIKPGKDVCIIITSN